MSLKLLALNLVKIFRNLFKIPPISFRISEHAAPEEGDREGGRDMIVWDYRTIYIVLCGTGNLEWDSWVSPKERLPITGLTKCVCACLFLFMSKLSNFKHVRMRSIQLQEKCTTALNAHLTVRETAHSIAMRIALRVMRSAGGVWRRQTNRELAREEVGYRDALNRHTDPPVGVAFQNNTAFRTDNKGLKGK